MDYNQKYNQKKAYWGKKIHPLIQDAVDRLPAPATVFDLGCGQGRHAVFLAKAGYAVHAVDTSEVAISQLKEQGEKESLLMHLSCEDVCSFIEKASMADILLAINIFQFISAEQINLLIQHMKEKTRKEGIHVITAFLAETDK